MARAMSLVVLLAANAASPALAAKGARRLSSITGYVMTDSNIFDAVELWLLDEDAADIKYGHITAWDTSAVTDMSCLFKAEEDNGCWYYNAEAASFDEHLEAWDVSHVDTMWNMFNGAARRGNRPATNAPRTVTSAQAPLRSTKTWATGTCPIPRT